MADYDSNIFPSLNKRIRDLRGQKFGKLTVLEYAGSSTTRSQKLAQWLCQCECGTIKIIVGRDMAKPGPKRTVSCGCVFAETNRWRRKRGRDLSQISYSREYAAFHSAKARCENPTDKSYHHYGERGIKFLLTSIEEMLADIGHRPSPNHSLDRKDVNGHYEKGNIRWATPTEQMRNRQHHTTIEAFGRSQILAEWVEESPQSRTTISHRLKSGWCAECAISNDAHQSCPHRP